MVAVILIIKDMAQYPKAVSPENSDKAQGGEQRELGGGGGWEHQLLPDLMIPS